MEPQSAPIMAQKLTKLINDAYRVGETGILVDTPTQPFCRVTLEEVTYMIQNQQLLVVYNGENETVGCIKVTRTDQEGVAEWGCLAVSDQGKGWGRKLVEAAHKHIVDQLECHTAQLELLAPSRWKHEHKERLREWYLRLGYQLKVNNDYQASTVTMPEGSVLASRFVLATKADFTCYQKKLCEVVLENFQRKTS